MPRTRGDPKTVFGLILAGLERRRGGRHAAVHGHVVRQHSPQRPRHAGRRRRARGAARSAGSRTGSAPRSPFPTAWSTASRPATADRERRAAGREFGLEDDWPVFCESSGSGCWRTSSRSAGRRSREVGVQFVAGRAAVRADEDPHPQRRPRDDRLSRRRCSTSISCTRRWRTPLVRDFLASSRPRRSSRSCRPVPDTDLDDYFALIERRFANPKIGDTIPRLCLDGSNRQPKFILPSTRDRLAPGPAGDGARARVRPCGAGTARSSPTRAPRSRRTTRAGTGCGPRPSRRSGSRAPSWR